MDSSSSFDDSDSSTVESLLAFSQPSITLQVQPDGMLRPNSQLKSQAETISIGVQTESNSTSIDLTIPLWSLAMGPDHQIPASIKLQQRREQIRQESSHSSILSCNRQNEDNAVVATTNFRNQTNDSVVPASANSFENDKQSPSDLMESRSNSTCPLYPDVIRVIFRYLDNHELITSIQLSRQWHQSLRTASLHRITSYASGKNLTRIQENSAMALRVARAVNIEEAIRLSQDNTFPGCNLSSHLRTLLPNLTTLNVVPASVPQVLPLHLETISVEVDKELNCAPLFKEIQQLSQLRHLRLKLPSQQLDTLDFSSLLPLPQLRSLEVFSLDLSTSKCPRSAALVKFVRATRLNSLTLTFFYSKAIVTEIYMNLLEPSSSGEPSKFPLLESLTSIHLQKATLDCALLQTLTKYPSLTSLSLMDMSLSRTDMQLFLHLPKLRELKLVNPNNKDRIPTTPSSESIVIACKYLSNLSVFHVNGNEQFTTQLLDECLAQLPNLTDLSVDGDGAGSNYAPIIQYGLPKRLTKLTLRRFYAPPSDLSDYILPLQLLESLELCEVCSSEPHSDLVERVRNMPKLIHCDLNLRAPFTIVKQRPR